MNDVFSFDDFLNKNGGKKPSTNSIKNLFLDDEIEVEDVVVEKELIKESFEEEEVKPESEVKSEVKTEEKKREVKPEPMPIPQEEEVEEEEFEYENAIVNVEDDSDYYKLYQDKNEEFSCDIMIEGSSIEETETRIILETDTWNLVFPGEIKRGKCIVPIKKLGILKEGEIGKIKLEVITEGNLFIPWENEFKVKLSKKVIVKMNETKKPTKSSIPSKIGVKVNVK